MIRKEVKFLELKTFFFLLALLLLSIMVITISTNSLISYDKYSNNDKYSYYHKAYRLQMLALMVRSHLT